MPDGERSGIFFILVPTSFHHHFAGKYDKKRGIMHKYRQEIRIFVLRKPFSPRMESNTRLLLSKL